MKRMKCYSTKRITAICSIAFASAAVITGCQSGRKPDFSTEIKPILNKHCISCHGGVKQSGGFSVLFREDALGKTKSGKPAIIPFHPEESEFIRRLTCKDPKERMPQKGTPLNKEEIELLTQWVKSGAEWGEHWAYVAPKAATVPDPNHAIDYFIEKKRKEEGLSAAPEADKMTLLRRVCLDLTGLPPTPQMAASFAAATNANAYEQLVDTLLQSPHFGERWASMWLDLARYSDTKGYERDAGRQIWRYRDWVIDAFNKDMPYDTFTIHQLAGDLLPDPDNNQMIATAFNRNTMANDEGGTQDEEFRTAAVMDRVATTMDVFQGVTIGCVQCHSHPYDPFRFEDYYKLLAFLNDTRDEDTQADYPKLRLYDSLALSQVKEINNWVAANGSAADQKDVAGFLRVLEPKVHAHDCDEYINGALADTKYLGIRNGGSCRLPKQPLNNRSHFLMNYWTSNTGGTMEVHLDSLKGKIILSHKLQPTKGRQVVDIPILPVEGTHDLYLVFRNPALDKASSVCEVEWFAYRNDLPGKGKPGFDKVYENMMAIINKNPEDVPVMIENPALMHRVTHVFERGNWMVTGKAVTPDVPHSLNPFPKNAPRNRLGLAEWITADQNPLTARVIVNRIWEQLFGIGIVETLEDFGTQGFTPSHPEMLDYLSYQLMHKNKWHLKPMIREIVLSAAYKQSSATTPALLEKDPANRYLARGPHFRLTAEEVRDQALAVSGLLNPSLHGPSVMPYQPDNIWQTVWSGEYWKKADNGNQYRRAIYVYQKRTSPYPSMLTYDGSSREVCLQRRIRTNTPLQALTTLNDPVYVETAAALALRMQQQGKDAATCIRWGYQQAMFKQLPENKLKALMTLYDTAFSKYSKDATAARKLIEGATGKPSGDSAQTAALVVVANAIMNLDEFLIKS